MAYTCYDVFEHMIGQTHLLVAGASGCGKSVLTSGILFNLVTWHNNETELVLIDPKRVELKPWSKVRQCKWYADDLDDICTTLQKCMDDIDLRYKRMQRKGLYMTDEKHVYVFIDELADLMTTRKKVVLPLLQRISQIGRAAGYHLIACTQSPLAVVIPSQLRINFDARVGMHCRTRQESRNMVDMNGCELLPRYGEVIYVNPDGWWHQNIPMISKDDINEVINMRKRSFWKCLRG